MKNIKSSSLLPTALVSLGLHGVLAMLLVPSVFKISPETPLSFEVAWLMPSPSCQSPSSSYYSSSPLCPLRASEDPERSQQKKKPVPVKTLSPSLKKIQSPSPKHLEPRLRGEDTEGKRSLTGPKFSRSQNEAQMRESQSHHPLPSYPWVCRKRRQEGVVCLHIKTNQDGRVVEARLHKSSGYDLLDKAALEAVKSWILSEGNSDKTLSIAFRLKEEKVSFS